MDPNGLIGKQNHLPWHIKEDLEYFKATTMGHPVVMGKNTWLSIGKTLDGRINIILTHDTKFHIPGCVIKHSVEEVLSSFTEEDIYVIGGANVFAQFLPYADKLYITRIKQVYEGDTYFPEVSWADWKIDFYEQKSTTTGIELAFERWDRVPETRVKR
jgi:dihydrofolate reductase